MYYHGKRIFYISVILMNIVNCNYFLVGGSGETSYSGGTSFKMKRPTLLRQLQTILVKYPDDSQILRVSSIAIY